MSTASDDATARLFAQVRAELPPSRAMVLSDASGRWFHWHCGTCERRGQAAKDRKLIQQRADAHNSERHGGR